MKIKRVRKKKLRKKITKNKKRKKAFNIICKIIASISTLISLVFCILLFKIDMLPTKYLIAVYSILGSLLGICLIFAFIDKIKKKFKIFALIIFILFAGVLGIGNKYLIDTIGFVDTIDNVLFQHEEYYLMVLDSSSINKIEELENKKIGIYDSVNSETAIKKLNKKLSFEEIKFSNIIQMFDELEENNLDAVLINDSIRNLLDTELSEMNLKLKKIYSISIRIEKTDIVKVVDVSNTPFNIYVAGGDSYGSIDKVTNTDVNMIVSVDPVNRKILLTSIPRDYYVNLPSFGENAYDKITHAGYYGINESILAVEKLLNIDINYYVKVNFSTIEQIINAIGGIDVYSDYAFQEQAFGIYYFKKGNIHLNGRQALAFARERKAFTDGDVQRVKNQQKVLEATIDKVSSSTALIKNFSKILDSVSGSFSTNMKPRDISKLVKLQLNDMRSWSFESQNLTGTDLRTSNAYTFPGTELYVMKSDANSVAKAVNNIKNFFENE